MPTNVTRPVVALDVDGVLNAAAFPDEHVLNVPAEAQPKSPFLRGGGQRDLTIPIRIDPGVGVWIRDLQRSADVVWATTWEHVANTHLAPLLGIDELPVACAVEQHPPRFGYIKDGDSIGWKASVLRHLYPGRPLAWIDDGAWAYTHEQWNVPEERTWNDWRFPWPHEDDLWSPYSDPEYAATADVSRAPTLVVTPRYDVGLTLEERAPVAAFVADPFAYQAPMPVR